MYFILRAAVIAVVIGTAHAQGDDATEGDNGFTLSTQELERCREVIREMPGVVRNPLFQTAPNGQRVGILQLWVLCAGALEDNRAAFEAFGWLAPVSPEPDLPYRTRIALALQLDETQAAVEALNAWSQVSPSGLATLELSTIGRLLRQAGRLRDGEEIMFEIHETLERVGYALTEPLDSDQSLRVEHARLLLERGRIEDATRRLGDPGGLTFATLVVLRAERLFDPVFAAVGPLDVVAEAERRVDQARESIAEYPRLLKAHYRYMLALRDAGRNAEAIEEADLVLDLIASTPEAFDDVDEYLNWIHNDRAYALYALDRPREGRDAMATAAATDENGDANVSQAINRGLLLADEGRWEEAIGALAVMGQASVYGEMFAAAVRVCAAEEMGNDTMIAVELTYLRTHATENFPALQHALVCANEFDEAAELYVRRLGDPMARTAALMALQRWAPAPGRMRARDKVLQRLETVQERPAVQSALAEVGRSLEIPLPIAYWGNRY